MLGAPEYESRRLVDCIPTILVCLAAAAVICFVAVNLLTPHQEPTGITIDTTDEELMHELGLPTKADVEMWHDVHRWGYSTENVMHTEHVYTELPGRNDEAWDRLYGIGE